MVSEMAMQLAQLISYFETSPAMRLLRSPNAPFIVDFLHQQFKEKAQLAIPMSELVVALGEYREEIHESYPDVLREKPEQYVSAWCAGDSRWLHRFLEANRNEPVYQLTPHTEDVFLFLDRALQKDMGFVGTESRLRLVISTLADLVAGASDDPEVHLRHLREERARIDTQIAQVERDGVAARYEPAAIRERFATAVTLLKQLMADFRAVEDRFREITKDVQRRQSQGQDTRGSILEYALDSEDILKKEDQGVSFYEFVRFILSPAQQEKLQGIITDLGRLVAIAQQADGLATVRRMVPLLLAEAEKVMRTNQRLSATLRRLLDSRSAADRQRLAQLLAEIRSLAAACAESPPGELLGVKVDTGIALALPFSRTFWNAPASFTPIDLTEYTVDDEKRWEAFRLLAGMHRLDWRSMRQHIAELAGKHGSATIGQIIGNYPPLVGVVELLAYLQIARDDDHLISRQNTEQVRVRAQDSSQRDLQVTIPLVHFIASERDAHA
jgi:hypothetical protein